jgi:predicted DNA-binding transcriptional regulator AlpA
MRILSRKALRLKGVDFSDDQLRRLMNAGTFPKPITIGGRRVHWIEAEIDQYLERLVSERDGAK